VEFYWLPPFLAGFFDLFLALLVLHRGPYRSLNRVFTFFALSLTSWNFDIASLYFFSDYQTALQWSEHFRYGMLFIPPTLFHLAIVLTNKKTLPNHLFLAVGYVIALALAFANGWGVLVQQLEEFRWGFYPVSLPLYRLHTFSDIFYFTATLHLLIREFFNSESARQREQLRLALLGFAVALPVGLTNLLPVYGIDVYPLGSFGNVFWCITLTYAIVRHRFLDVELIITKTVASVSALVLWLAPLWLLTTEIQHRLYGAADARLLWFAVTVFMLSAVVFPWLLRTSEDFARRLLWGQRSIRRQ